MNDNRVVSMLLWLSASSLTGRRGVTSYWVLKVAMVEKKSLGSKGHRADLCLHLHTSRLWVMLVGRAW